MPFSVNEINKQRLENDKELEREKQEQRNKARDEQSEHRAQERKRVQMEKDQEKLKKEQYIIQSARVRQRIKQRFEAFPFLNDFIKEPKLNATFNELVETEEAQKNMLDRQGAKERIDGMIVQGATVIEQYWGDGTEMTFLPEKLRFDLTGISDVIQHPITKAQLEPLIQETIIEYPQFGQMGLMQRWLLTIGGIWYTTRKFKASGANSFDEYIETNLNMARSSISELPGSHCPPSSATLIDRLKRKKEKGKEKEENAGPSSPAFHLADLEKD